MPGVYYLGIGGQLMSRFRNKFVKRVMAVILSSAMIMSCMPSSNMTAFASENPVDTGGGVH